MRDQPFSLDKLVDVTRYAYKGSFLTKCDDKSGYDHILLSRFTYLGLVVDTARQAFLLPQDKVVKFAKLPEAILASKKFVQVKTLQRFQGKFISFSPAVPGSKLFIRSTAAAIASAGSNPQVPMSPVLREELTHWRFVDTWKDCIPWRDEKHLILSMSSNSYGFAWGGVFSPSRR